MIAYIKEEACIGCGLCVRNCPMDVIRMKSTESGDIAEIRFPEDCMSCYNCEFSCPEPGTIYVDPKRTQWVRLPW